MFLCALKVFVRSTSKAAAEELVSLIRDVAPLEDCEYQLEPSGFDDPCTAGVDSAVIIDRDIEKLRAYKRHSDERIVFLAAAAGVAGLDSETISKVDDLWVMPDAQENDASLLKVYFERLLATMKDNFDSRRAEICFRTIIDSLPDMAWFKDNDGVHLMVNNEFCTVVEKSKEQVYKKRHNYIWDVPEDDHSGEAVCRQSEDIVVKKRKTCQFEEQINTKYGMRQLITYKSPLIDKDGSIFGTCGIGHDVTDLQNISNELRIIIDSIPFGVVIEDSWGNVILINKFLQKLMPDITDSIGQNFKEWCGRLQKEKIGTEQGEDEYRVIVNGNEYIFRFQEEPIVDIFSENIGKLQLIRDVTVQYKFEQQNIQYANTDFLTGLNNRRSLFDYLKGLEKNSMLSLIMVDLDKFKSVNDIYGHAAGDEALEITSRVLVESFPDGFVARLGGDEFLVSIVGEYELAQMEQRAQKLLETLLENYSVKKAFQGLSASIGIAQDRLSVCNTKNIEKLMKRADTALYTAKQSGKARCCVDR